MGYYTRLAKKQGLKAKPVTKQTVHNMISKASETKMFQPNIDQSVGGNTWSTYVVSNVIQGVEVSSRVANKITPTIFKYRLRIAQANANTTGDVVRVIFFTDKESRGAIPTVTNFGLANDSTGDKVIIPAIDNFNTRFRIISDKTYDLDTSQRILNKATSFKLRSPMKFGTEADDYLENALFMFIWTSNNTNKSVIDVQGRLFYKD